MKIGYVFLGLFALAGFLMSAFVNIAAYAGINLWEEMPAVQLLHYSAIGLVFATMAAGYNRDFGRRSKAGKVAYRKAYPLGLRLFINAVGIFAFINFMTVWGGMFVKPVPQHLSGTYYEYLSSAGDWVYIDGHDLDEPSVDESRLGDTVNLHDVPVERSRENQISIFTPISETEYSERQTPLARMYSGHWMFFHLEPAVYFLYYKGLMSGTTKRKNDDLVMLPSADGGWVNVNDMSAMRDN